MPRIKKPSKAKEQIRRTGMRICTEIEVELARQQGRLDFKGNDQLKTNTVLQMRDSEIEFKTI